MGWVWGGAGWVVAIWAGYQLGRNWGGNGLIKQEHVLITTGPYAWVRHPIYSGLLLLFCGTALMVGDWRGSIAVAIVFTSFWFKLHQEERFLAPHSRPPYPAYARRTKRVLPGVPWKQPSPHPQPSPFSPPPRPAP